MEENYQKIQEAGAELIAISSENVALTGRTVENSGLTYPVLSDNKKETINAYNVLDINNGVYARPAAYIITPDKTIVWKSINTTAARVPTANILAELGKL